MLNILLISFLSISILQPITGAPELTCPPLKSIRPCDCTTRKEEGKGQGQLTLVCDGPRITDESIDRLIKETRSHNGLSSNDWLDLHSIDIQYTDLRSLNLAPFYKTRLNILSIVGNAALESLSQPTTKSEGQTKNQIETESMTMSYNKLNDLSFGQSLTSFSPILKYLELNNNQITGGQYSLPEGQGIEFIPGLSHLEQLIKLNLNGNYISKIEGGQFKNNRNIQYLSFIDSQVEKVGAGGFEGILDENEENKMLEIFLASNSLNEDKFDAQNGLQNKPGPVHLDLRDNEFSTLPAETFEPFLFKNDLNSLTAYRNRFICNEKVKWLKNKRQELENRVSGIVCKNQPDRNVFNSDKI